MGISWTGIRLRQRRRGRESGKNVPIAVLGGTLGAAVIYIVSTNVIAGIVPNMDLANSTAPFGLAFAQMFTPAVGKVIMALMVMSCCGSLLGWQFTIAQVLNPPLTKAIPESLLSCNESRRAGSGDVDYCDYSDWPVADDH